MFQCLSSLIKVNNLKQYSLQFINRYFVRRAKNSQLILYTPEQIANLIEKKNKKTSILDLDKKPWTTNVQNDIKKFRVSLVGLPNCGKSSLFNCLIG
jgi:ribosome biogenesis GTPase A